MIWPFGETRSGYPVELSQEKEKILPSGVLYALAYREARLGKKEIQDLIHSGFINEALYLLLKATTNSPETQKHLLEFLLHSWTQRDHSIEGVASQLKNYASTLKEDVSVAGAKIAQLSRQGFDTWQHVYEGIADKHFQHESNTTPVLVAYATTVGLQTFISKATTSNKDFLILIPDWISSPDNSFCGYKLVPQTGEVILLPKAFSRPEHSVLIDDTMNTGEKISSVVNFWTQDGLYKSPSLEIPNITKSSQK